MKKNLFLLFLIYLFATSVLAANKKARVSTAGLTKLVCVGDSITAGVGIKGLAGKYTTQLNNLLGNKWKVYRFGVSGATMLKKGDKPYWDEKLFPAVAKNKPDVITIFLGTNDTQAKSWKHKADFTGDYKDMIKTFSEIESKPKIYICLPVPIFKKGGVLSEKIMTQEIIPQIKKIGEETNCTVIDLYTPLRNKPDYFRDGVHPNEKGAKIIAETMHAALTKAPAK